MKTLAIMQPYLFPYIGYFQLINAVDDFVIYDDVQYIVGGWINRNNILINGEGKLFSVPLSHPSPNKLINEIEIKDDFRKLKKTLELAYSKAPYRDSTLQLLNSILDYSDKNLARFAAHSLGLIAGYLGIQTKFLFSSDLDKDNNLRAQYKVLAICKRLDATTYINPIGGREIYNRQYFSANDIDLKFIQTGQVKYKQFGNNFIPNLSIIDVMMFNSKESIQQILKEYALV